MFLTKITPPQQIILY